MRQHCQINMTNAPSRPMNYFGCPRLPRAVSNPPLLPPAGWTQTPGACGFDAWECSWEHHGNLRFMPCKKTTGSMKSSWELFLLAVWSHVNKFCSQEFIAKFPGTCSKFLRNGSWELILMCPSGGIQAGRWMGLVSRENLGLKS